jgi:hypothetical protein
LLKIGSFVVERLRYQMGFPGLYYPLLMSCLVSKLVMYEYDRTAEQQRSLLSQLMVTVRTNMKTGLKPIDIPCT